MPRILPVLVGLQPRHDVFDNAVARLFEDEKNAIEIIKIKEVLSALETATDKCEDAANVIESVMIKQA